MEEQERLTMEFVKSLMDKSYTLVWVDYNDNLDNCRDTIQKCLEERSCESLWEKVDEWYGDAEWESVREIISKLKDECTGFHGFEEEEVDKFFEEHEDEIREEIYDRNDSDTLKELLKTRMTSPCVSRCYPTTTASIPTGWNRRKATGTRNPISGI